MTTTQAITKKQDRETLESILARPGYQVRFKEVLQDKAAQFCSSLVSIGHSMPDVEPKSIVGAGMIAACLDLPIDKNLGFAWIVPYKKSVKVGNEWRDVKLAQFQLGYKGYIQLAQRTAYYSGMNAMPINKEAYGGRNSIGEPVINWDLVDETKEAVGYAFAFKMVNGFTKVCYWSKEKVMAHAKRYSQAFRSNFETPWKTNFDKMALKTVIANELSDWGILSVQFQLARKADQAVKADIDAEPEYIDTTGEVIGDGEHKPELTDHQQAQGTTEVKKDEKKADKGGEKAQKQPQEPPKDKTATSTPAKTEAPANPPAASETKAPSEPAQGNAAPATATTSEKVPEPAKEDPESVVFEQISADGQTEQVAATDKPAFVPNPNETPELQEVRRLLWQDNKTEAQLVAILKKNKAMRDEQTTIAELTTKKHQSIAQNWAGLLKYMV